MDTIKEQPEQCVSKETRIVLSAERVMAIVLWDFPGIFFGGCLKKGFTITDARYASLLNRLEIFHARKL